MKVNEKFFMKNVHDFVRKFEFIEFRFTKFVRMVYISVPMFRSIKL